MGEAGIGVEVVLRKATTLEDYVRDPFGRYVSGPTFVAYWAGPNTNGITFWGRPDEEHLSTVIRALDAVLEPGRPNHRVLIDASRLSAVDVRAFTIMASYMIKHRAVHARLCTRQALVRPNGLPGAVVAGFYALVDPGYPVRVFQDAEPAIRWLEIPERGGLLAELERIRSDQIDDAARFLSDVRACLDKVHGRATLHVIASTLAVSDRTLQRKLLEAGSSFRNEVSAAQLRLAKTLLVHGDKSIKSVAVEVGYASPSHFSAFFRRLTGKSPVSWASSRGESVTRDE